MKSFKINFVILGLIFSVESFVKFNIHHFSAGYYRSIYPAPINVPIYIPGIREGLFVLPQIAWNAAIPVNIGDDCPIINQDFCAWKVNYNNMVVAVEFGTYMGN